LIYFYLSKYGLTVTCQETKKVSHRDKQLDKKDHSKRFEEVLQDSIDEAFSSLGEAVKTSIYFHLEHKFLITRRDIPLRIEDFCNALEQIFGLGAKHLELLIMKNLYEKVNCLYRWEGPKWLVPDLTFKKYVELIRISCDEDKIGTVEVIVDAGEPQEQPA
jgi:hypothetical protein